MYTIVNVCTHREDLYDRKKERKKKEGKKKVEVKK
jgi:hypothetical protein